MARSIGIEAERIATETLVALAQKAQALLEIRPEHAEGQLVRRAPGLRRQPLHERDDVVCCDVHEPRESCFRIHR
ncbi:MAG TPA: hypothetical protein VI072_25235, partial [Polyangiaceae bacterium]